MVIMTMVMRMAMLMMMPSFVCIHKLKGLRKHGSGWLRNTTQGLGCASHASLDPQPVEQHGCPQHVEKQFGRHRRAKPNTLRSRVGERLAVSLRLKLIRPFIGSVVARRIHTSRKVKAGGLASLAPCALSHKQFSYLRSCQRKSL